MTYDAAEVAGLIEPLLAATADDARWVTSPFRRLLSLPPRTRGSVGEHLVERWAAGLGLPVGRADSSHFDRRIGAARVEVKLSTLWVEGFYRFQQIRDQGYDLAVFVGISPFDVHAWCVPKAVLAEHVIGRLGQHTGKGGAETAWVSVTPGAEPAWLAPFGSTLEVAGRELVARAGVGQLSPPHLPVG